jgi:2-polyprenyl-3-methyl-5-hydroxy-6-metoxy-1,4-benzoquinol methylase
MNVLRETSTPEYWNNLYESGKYLPGLTSFERRMFRGYVAARPGMVALDAGCGQGEVAAYLGAWGLNVLGLDFAATAIDEARREFKDQNNVTFGLHDFNDDAPPAGLQPGSLDIVVCRLSLAHMDRHRFVVDAQRWLKPSGVLHITTHVIDHTPPALRHRGLTEAAIEDLETGWGRCVRYDLERNGSLTCLVLRKPHD